MTNRQIIIAVIIGILVVIAVFVYLDALKARRMHSMKELDKEGLGRGPVIVGGITPATRMHLEKDWNVRRAHGKV
jgi:hypothetical protein